MSDHNFEKQIQQKLEELKIPPADTVWSGVQAQIRQDKRRRKGIIFFPAVLLLIGACSYFIFKGKFPDTRSLTGIPSSKPNADRNNATTITKPINEHQGPGGQTENPSTNNPGNVDDLQQQTDKSPEAPTKKVAAGVGTDQSLQPNSQIGFKKPINRSHTLVTNNTTAGNTNGKIKSQGLTEKKNMDVKKSQSPGIDRMREAESIASEITAVPNSRTDNATTQPATNPALDSVKNDKIASDKFEDSLVSNITEVKNQPVKINYSNWKWGITASAGISNLNDGGLFNGGLFNSVLGGDKALVADVAVNPNANAPQSGGSGIHTPSAIEKGFSFSLGGFVQKTLNKRFSISTGIRYSYYSTHIRVGNRIDSVRMVQNAFGALNVTQFYRATPLSSPLSSAAPIITQKYTNDFHFLELPISVHMRLNNGRRLPIFWNSGISLSYLFSTNALHFDSRTGVYYKDNSLFNKFQANLSTGFSISLFNSSKRSLDIGPQFQYGLSNLMKGQVSPGKHLYYYGVNAKIFLKK